MSLDFTEKAISRLKQRGYRMTMTRKVLIKTLAEIEYSISAYELKDLIASRGQTIDTVSIYRILDCLEQNGLIHRVLASGKVIRCVLENEEECQLHQHYHCHHLLICQKCGEIKETHCPEALNFTKAKMNLENFKITGHNLEFFGYCSKCA